MASLALAYSCGLCAATGSLPHPLSAMRRPSQNLSPEAREWMRRFPGYAYGGKLYDMKRTEFAHESPDHLYLDFTGAGVYRRSQLEKTFKDLESHLYCNTHSNSNCSKLTERVVNEVRDMLLDFFNAPRGSYTVIFTSSATAALKLVGEAFPWSNRSHYMYSKHNHNSVLGIRRLAKSFGAEFHSLPWDVYKMNLSEEVSEDLLSPENLPTARSLTEDLSVSDRLQNETHHLVAFLGQCNFAGAKYPLDLIHAFQFSDFGQRFVNHSTCDNQPAAGADAQDEKYTHGCRRLADKANNWHVLLDAAALVPTSRLDLNRYPATFVAMSFYKMFGFPTGVGALLVRNDIAPLLRKNMFFAGGSVAVACCDTDFCKLKPQYHERFEDGTLNYYGISQLRFGLESLRELGMDNINDHVWAVTRRLYEGMYALHYPNGQPFVRIYGEHELNDQARQGGIVSFNVLDKHGSYVGYYETTQRATDHGFMIRSGCCCNPGSCVNYLGIAEDDVIRTSAERNSCGDEIDMVDGKPLGAIRVSVGYSTTIEEIDKFLQFMQEEMHRLYWKVV